MNEGVQVQNRWQLRSSRWNSDLKGSLQSQGLCSLWQLFSFIFISVIKISWQKARACLAHTSNSPDPLLQGSLRAGPLDTAPTGKSSEKVIHRSLQRNKENKCVSPCLLACAQIFSLTVLGTPYLPREWCCSQGTEMPTGHLV